MTERDSILLDLLNDRVSNCKIGILATGLYDIDIVSVLSELSSISGKSISAAVVGYGITPLSTDNLFVSSSIEDAVLWRSKPEMAGRILAFVKEDAEKLHSLAEFDTVTMRDLTEALIHKEEAAAPNEPTKRFWEALADQSSYHKYEDVELFCNSVHQMQPSGDAIPASMWILGLLRDDAILNGSTKNGSAAIGDALVDNRRQLANAGQMSAEANKRLSSWITHAKDSEKDELNRKYNLLQKYIEFGNKRDLQDLDFATVRKFLSISKKSDSTETPPTTSHTTRPKEIDADLIEALFTDDEETISDIKKLVSQIEESWSEAAEGGEEGKIHPDGGKYDGTEIECPKNDTPMRKLVRKLCTMDSWGGILFTKEKSLKDAITSDEKEIHPFNPFDNDGVTSFDSKALFDFLYTVDELGLDGHIEFKPIIHELIESRKRLLEHIDSIMALPLWVFGSNPVLCDELFRYVDLWGQLYNACKNNHQALKAKSPLGSKVIAKAVVLLDTLFIKTPQEWKAILLPLNPMFLWRYYEILKTVKKDRDEALNPEDIHDIKEAISELPNVVNVIVANSLITGGENKNLPNSGEIDSLPTFENRVNRYTGEDGIKDLADIFERWIGFAPFSKEELRVCAVDIPEFPLFIKVLKDYLKKRGGSSSVILDAFMTEDHDGNLNGELSKLDYDGSDFEIGELITTGRLEITTHSVKGAQEVKQHLIKKPVHIAIFFEQSKYTTQYEPSHKTLYVSPLVVAYDYTYDSVTHRGTIFPSSDTTSGLIGDYHRILENADIVETDMNAQTTYLETAGIADILSTLDEHLTQWLVIADRTTDCFEPPNSIPIGEKRGEKRTINTWAAADSRIITQYVSMLCNYNLFPQKERLCEILKQYGHIASTGLISIPKFGADGNAAENEKKGLLGTLFAAVKYCQDHVTQIPLVASLDTENAKLWLRNSKFGNDRADLIGMRYDATSETLYVDAIEVKTRDNSSDISPHKDGTISGHAAEQVASIVGNLYEIFGMSDTPGEDLFVSARKETLKFQIVSECFRKTHAPASQETWAEVFRKAFSDSPSVHIVIGGIIYHFDMSQAPGGTAKQYTYAGEPHCQIILHTMTTKEIQTEIFDTPNVFDLNKAIEDDLEESGYEFIDQSDSFEVFDEEIPDIPNDQTVSPDTVEAETIPVAEEQLPQENTIVVSQENVNSPETDIPRDKVLFSKETRFLLGSDVKTGTKYYWEFGDKNLSNRHLLINGNSGFGKTYCIQGLLLEAVRCGVSAVVFDYTSGFTTGKLDPAFKEKTVGKITQRFVKTSKLPINPFQKHDNVIDEDIVIPEDNVDVASRLSSIFTKIYDLGDQQKSAVYSAVLNGLKKFGDNMSFQIMASELEDIGTSSAKSVLSKIQPFIDLAPFDSSASMDWGDIRDSDGQVYIIQLAGYERDVQVLLTEILLWDIWNFCVKTGNEDRPFILVMDEAQNLDHGEKSPSAKILTEGRKFGISGWYATQFMKPQLTEDEIQRLQQASQKLYFCPPDDGILTVAKNIDITPQGTKDWADKLKRLKKGECVTCGNMNDDGNWIRYNPRIIKIAAIQARE